MTDCGEQLGSVHRCGECGEDTYAVADLEVLHMEFDDCDWPDKSLAAFLDWLKGRGSFPLLYELPANIDFNTDRVVLLRPDLSKEEDDDELAP